MDIALGLSDPGCGGDVNCLLKDNFASDYVTNWRQLGDMSLVQPSGIVSGTLFGTSSLEMLTIPGSGSEVSLRSRRAFSDLLTERVDLQLFGIWNESNRASERNHKQYPEPGRLLGPWLNKPVHTHSFSPRLVLKSV